MQKIIYFTAGQIATQAELTAIAAVLADQFEVNIRNSKALTNYGPRIEECDFVLGTVPTEYSSKPVWSGGGSLGPDQAIVDNDQVTKLRTYNGATLQSEANVKIVNENQALKEILFQNTTDPAALVINNEQITFETGSKLTYGIPVFVNNKIQKITNIQGDNVVLFNQEEFNGTYNATNVKIKVTIAGNAITAAVVTDAA